jgi:hypothetical protein
MTAWQKMIETILNISLTMHDGIVSLALLSGGENNLFGSRKGCRTTRREFARLQCGLPSNGSRRSSTDSTKG